MHVMIDLETMSTRANAAIVQIGAVCFDPNSGLTPMKEPFNRHIELASSIAVGSHVDAGTVMWWLGQDQAARDALRNGQQQAIPLRQALDEFVAWLPKAQLHPWSHGASFDIPILEVAFSRFGLKAPWDFWNIRDTRTLFDLSGKKMAELMPKREGVKHSAADDAIAQAQAVCAAWRLITEGRAA